MVTNKQLAWVMVILTVATLAMTMRYGWRLFVTTTIISAIPEEYCPAIGGECHVGVGCGWKTAQPPSGNCVTPQTITYICNYDYCKAALAGSSLDLQSCQATTAPELGLPYLYYMKRGDIVTFPTAGGYKYVKVVEVEHKCPVIETCLQVITNACNPTTKEIREYPTSCIPEGWTADLSQCAAEPAVEPSQDFTILAVIVALGAVLVFLLIYAKRKKR